MPPCILFYLVCRQAITIRVHSIIFSLVGSDVVPFANPSAIIHCSHCCQIWFLNSLFTPMLTGWHNEVHPPGKCSTSVKSPYYSFRTVRRSFENTRLKYDSR